MSIGEGFSIDMKVRYINALLVLAAIVGVSAMVVGLVHGASPTASTPEAPAVVSPAPLAPPIASPPPEPIIPPGMPVTITVQTPAGILIDHKPVDQNLLAVQAKGVVPGKDPGLYVASGTSTLPATHPEGTVIIGGHALPDPPMVFNPLMRLESGDVHNSQVILEMPGGQLDYTIEAIYLVTKTDLPTQRALADNRPGRIELITCDLEDGKNTFQNRIVVACDSSHVGCST